MDDNFATILIPVFFITLVSIRVYDGLGVLCDRPSPSPLTVNIDLVVMKLTSYLKHPNLFT